MKTVGVICEYNPFHNGHAKQLRAIRSRFGEDAAVVCLMSGNFVQRGEPALFQKCLRARAAVSCGADLILELPLTYALRSAEGFAAGGVEILDAIGADAICFGCESGDSNLIMSTAKALLTPQFDELLRAELETGVSYAAAREAALSGIADASALRRPNDILAVEYCKAILRQGSRMEVFAISRDGDYHGTKDDPEDPSASYLRGQITSGGTWEASVPASCAALYRNAPRYTTAAGERAVLAIVRTLPDAAFAALPFGAEGLWNKLMKACRSAGSVEEILDAVKSKRYARTRIRRMLLCAYLGLTEEDLQTPAPYVRILAFNDRGRTLLRSPRKIPLVNAGSTPPDAAFYETECRASDLYALFCEDAGALSGGQEQKNRIIYQDSEKNTCIP